jgi:6,7-dimethyl-8-ribityllumazine synthase
MIRQENQGRQDLELYSGKDGRVLIIEAPYYEDVTNELGRGVSAVFDEAEVGCDWIQVPGALEIPQAFAQVVSAGQFDIGGKGLYAGLVVLGCVIRGETAHYDIVCNNTNHWLMDIAIRNVIPVGNGILTVDTEQQAMERARGGAEGKGGDAARACLRLMRIAQRVGRRA